MQPDLVLNEDQRKERFSVSRHRKKIKTEHVGLPPSKPVASVSPLLNSSMPITSFYPIVHERSQATEKSFKQELLMTIEHQEVKYYKASIMPKRVSVIIRRPPTNKSVTAQYKKNDIREKITNNNVEKLTKSGTAEPSIEYGPNFDFSEEHHMLDLISPQNHDQIPLETSISETMEIFLKDTNNDYIPTKFTELPEEEERPLTSKFQPENLEKEDTMGYNETSNDTFKQYSTGVTNRDSEEMQMILKYVHKKFGRMERRKQEYSKLSFDSSFLLKENLSTDKR